MPLSDNTIKINRVLQELEYLQICTYESAHYNKDFNKCIKNKIENEIVDRITFDDISACIENYFLLKTVEKLKTALEKNTSKEELLFMIFEILVEKNPEFQSIKSYKQNLEKL